MMAGYDYGAGMSNNAVDAYQDGLRPASKIRGVPSKLIARYCRADEWHHSSKFYNRVDFYDPATVMETFEMVEGKAGDPDAIAALSEWKASRTSDWSHFEKSRVTWVEFDPARGRKWKPRDVVHDAATVRVRGDTIEILTADRYQPVVRKKLSGRSICFDSGKPISALAWTRRLAKVAK